MLGAVVHNERTTGAANDCNQWENVYPSWNYDGSSGQWYQVGMRDTITGTQVSG